MPIILTGDKSQITTSSKLTAENAELRKKLRDAEIALNNRFSSGTQLIVNGQERKIGKKSHYLLDMLTLPEDK